MFCFASATTPHAGVWYVDDDASHRGDGTSWTTASKYLQDALLKTPPPQAGDDIRMAQGIYRPDANDANPDGTGDREATFRLVKVKRAALYGGRAGIGAPDPDERDHGDSSLSTR